MAFPSKLLLLITLLSIGFTFSLAQGQSRNLTLAGVITCANTSLSTVRTFPVIPQAKVDVVCGFLFFPSVTKSATTNSAGIYSISFNTADVLFNNPNACYLNVNLPANSCTFNPPGGALRFPIVAIRSDLGVVTAFVPGAMSYVP